MPSVRGCIFEKDIPCLYNERDLTVDDSNCLRNLYNLRLLNKEGQDISFNALGEGKPRGIVIAEIVEPFSQSWREKIMERIGTVRVANSGTIAWFDTEDLYTNVRRFELKNLLINDLT